MNFGRIVRDISGDARESGALTFERSAFHQYTTPAQSRATVLLTGLLTGDKDTVRQTFKGWQPDPEITARIHTMHYFFHTPERDLVWQAMVMATVANISLSPAKVRELGAERVIDVVEAVLDGMGWEEANDFYNQFISA